MAHRFDGAGKMMGILLPQVANGLATALRIGLVPDIDVTAGEGGNVGHGDLLVGLEMPRAGRARDDIRGNCA